MYVAMILILLGAAGLLLLRGFRIPSRLLRSLGVGLAVATVLFFWLLEFWGEFLWFEAVGYAGRFLEVILSQSVLGVAAAAAAATVVFLLVRAMPADRRHVRTVAVLTAALAGLAWGFTHWSETLMFLERVPVGVQDPVLGRDAGFYLFILPFLDAVRQLAYAVVLIAFASALFASVDITRDGKVRWRRDDQARGALFRVASFFAFVLAVGFLIDRYHILYSEWGAVSGPGWTDVHIRLPMLVVMAGASMLVAFVIALPPLRRWMERSRAGLRPRRILGLLGGGLAALWLVTLVAVPALLQWLLVEPNEITYEKPYIAHNIEFTRRAFRLHDIEEREFPLNSRFTRDTVQRNEDLFRNVRLWDWRALDAVYRQFQEIRLYYEFTDVDIDRYRFGDMYRQIMVSARELDPSNLPRQSQTFVNTRFKYTHGYGITLTSVSDFTPEGLPDLLIKDIPPKSRYPEIEVQRPQIYYGELTREHVIVNSSEEEFDHPRGDENVYVHYDGSGGVPISSFWRKFLFGFKFDGTRLLLSSYPTRESRIMFHRHVQERAQRIAPFLHFDDDPYVVLADGRLYWILDAYTTSNYYPYSEPFSANETIEVRDQSGTGRLFARQLDHLDGANYLRNSVKVVVDAYEGTVNFYVFDKQDALIRVWNRIFPEVFKPREQMPVALQQHVRYPVDMLLAQGLVYAKYHMTDPTVFYNQEDLWIRATEKYYNRVQPLEPYYVMWEPPGRDEAEFVLILPFTPKKRQVLIGWIAGMCDGDNYGRFLAYKFPKEQRVLGPQQVETKIDQDRFLSGQLTLWDQRGSNVIRGNVLAIPIERTLLYVEPIYLQAETAAYPELRLVVIMHEDNLSYAATFDEALRGLFDGGDPVAVETPAAEATFDVLVSKAQAAFEDYLSATGKKDFAGASQALTRLQQALQTLGERQPTDGNEPL